MSELKPCPFCGEAPVFPLARCTYGTCYEAGCEACGMVQMSVQIIDCFENDSIPSRDAAHNSWDGKEIQYGVEFIEVARQELISRWNNRPHENKLKAEAVLDYERSLSSFPYTAEEYIKNFIGHEELERGEV